MATAEAANKGGEGNDGAGAEGASKIGVRIGVRGAVAAAEAAKGEGVTEGGNDGAGAEGASTIGVCIGVCGAAAAAIGSGETGLVRMFVVATTEAVAAKVISDRAIPSSSLSTLILVVGS